MGLPGAGKSTLAEALSESLAWPVLSRDAIRRAMFAPPAGNEDEKRAAQDGLWAALRVYARQRRSCIVDGMSFADAGQRQYFRGLAAAYGARPQLVLLDCPLAEALRRAATAPQPDRSGRRVRQVAARFAAPDRAVLRLDARLSPATLCQQLLRLLATA